MKETSWLSDPIGRITNISLAPSPKNTLQPMFEALMNSIHAIEERFGADHLTSGKIDIEVTENQQGGYTGFVITDNGVGLNHDNMTSFRKSDSMKKVKIGGKGVGRLLWLKVADRVSVTSRYFEDGRIQKISFDFVPDPHEPISNLKQELDTADPGTTVNLSPLRVAYSLHIPVKLDTIAVRTVAHFINYFVNIGCPKITLFDSKSSITLFDKFSSDVERDKTYPIEYLVDGSPCDFKFHCFLVPKKYSDDEKGTNGLFFGANGRSVKRYDMDEVIGLKAIDEKFAFFGYLEGEALNGVVNDTRTDFSFDDSVIDDLKRECIQKMHLFLEKEIGKVKERQLQTIVEVRNEHLRFYNIAKSPEEIAEKLHLSTQKEEDIFVEMSRLSLRQYKRAKREFVEAKKKSLPDIEQKAKQYVAELKDESLSSLAEYVYKRKLILDVFEERSKYSDVESEKSHYERAVHELVCPLRSTKDELDYEDHNLWIVDDRLAFYSYFNSDKQLKAQAPIDDARRPDITFFDLGLGFEKGAGAEPVTIIEFKRPKRDDYTMEDNPFKQAQDYVRQLRQAGVATKFDGGTIRTIEESTPFLCQIVADDTKSLREVMQYLGGFYKRAGSGSYYRWDEGFKIFMELTSYAELISGAKARHAAFFERLGLSP
ncbi:MAG: ATP-binding protein [Tabrizicola sp.]|nr:ATP-binding protein [Tabrizicola sp.]